jgi:predicted GIY-YIG superfamily endonuclease
LKFFKIDFSIYVINCEKGKKYIGKTENFERRANQHFSGNGAKVTQKFEPKVMKEIDVVPGYFANEIEQEYTEEYMDKYG